MASDTTEIIPVSELEYKILKAIAEKKKTRLSPEELASISGLPLSSIYSGARLLESKGLIRVIETIDREVVLTKEGELVLERGLPEERLVKVLENLGEEATVGDLAKHMGDKELNIALGWARRKRLVEITKEGRIRLVKKPDKFIEKTVLEKVKKREPLTSDECGILTVLKKRGLVHERVIKNILLELTTSPDIVLRRIRLEVGRVTSSLITSGTWRNVYFRKYDVASEPPQLYPGRRHYYVLFINMLRRVLKEMGFVEVKGPLVEIEFWNFDVLFQAQDHPAREVHDTFWLARPKLGSLPSSDIVKRVGSVHESGGTTGSKGWGYKWDPEIARRLILRTQTTSVSARTLARGAKKPLRAFTIGKVFRPDVIDARHLPEFIQLDGIIMEDDTNFKTLLGTIKEFFERIGIEKVRFKPAYFPFTEPSVEGYIYIPGRGWVECFGAGMFRPEVLEILGVEDPVGAWGFGVERIAMSLMSIEDIRLLYTRDLSYLRSRTIKLRWWD